MFNQRLNTNCKSHTSILSVSPAVVRKEASPRLLATGGFDDQETNLVTEASLRPVTEASLGSGEITLPEVEGSTGTGETLISAFIALELFSSRIFNFLIQLIFKPLHGLFFFFAFFFLFIRSFATVSTHLNSIMWHGWHDVWIWKVTFAPWVGRA